MAVETLKSLGEDNVLPRAAMIAGEVLLPGASELVVGNIGSGVTTLAVTTLAVAALGPTMPLLALAAAIGMRANSYKRATTGTGLFGDLPRIEFVEDPKKHRDEHGRARQSRAAESAS
jgi:hypothetical protein